MKKAVALLLVCVCIFLQISIFSSCNGVIMKKYTANYFDYFDTVTVVIGYASSREEFDGVCKKITREMEKYHRLYDIYNEYEGVNNICTVNKTENGTHKKVKVAKEITDLLLYCKEVYTLTDGAVNVGMGSVLSVWHTCRAEATENPENAELPSWEELKKASRHTNINDVVIDAQNNTVYIKDPLLTLDVGAVAKGYAVEKAAQTLEKEGITGYIINAGGNVRTVGSAYGGRLWSVGIEDPCGSSESPYAEYLELSGEALVTSGAYQRFYTVNGKSYHHIIDSKTLYPAENFTSVSVVTKDSALGDALSTALFLMTYEQGKALVESTENAEAMWITNDGEKLYSNGFLNYTKK